MNAAAHEAEVALRFDQLEARFRDRLGAEDYRLRGLLDWLGPIGGSHILDVGCGKGRFSRAFRNQGASVVGIDLSAAMLREARGLNRVRGSARRLPFASGLFDCVVVVEVLQHLNAASVGTALEEFRRVLRPGGRLAIVDRNARSMNDRRPWMLNLMVKRIDEHRGLWMYPKESSVRERWFWPHRFQRHLQTLFSEAQIQYLLSPEESQYRLFHRFPSTRSMALWGARTSGGVHGTA